MPNIKPISDLRNYTKVLEEVAPDAPIYLTKNGRGKYVIVDIDEYERQQATIQLFAELTKGEQSAKEHGWLTIEEVKTNLGITRG